MIARLSPYIGLVAMLAVPGAARADVTSDFQNGSSIFIVHSRVRTGSVATRRTGTRIPKPAGALSFTVDVADLGVDLPIEVHLEGKSRGGGLIEFTFDDAYPEVDITGRGDMLLTRATGSVLVRLATMRGADAPTCHGIDCGGNVYVNVVSGSATAYGSWGSTTFTIDEAFGVGGVPRPRLGQLTPPPPTRNSQGTYTLPLCSSSTPTIARFGIWLGAPAPEGGARIDVTTPSPSTLRLAAGARSTVVGVKVPASFVGTLRVTAAAGGSVQSHDLVVRPASECRLPASRPAYEPYAPPSLVGCAGCSASVDVNGRVDRLMRVAGELRVIRDGAVYALRDLFPRATSAIDAVAINDLGWVAGRVTIDGVDQAYRADTVHGSYELLGQLTPLDVHASGAVVGYSVDRSGTPQAAYSTGRSIVALQLASSSGVRSSRALGVNDAGQVIGTYTDNAGAVRGFRWVDGTTSTLPAIPVAINQANQIAANGAGAVMIQSDGSVTELGSPSGHTGFHVTSLNRWGYAVGVATTIGTPSLQRAFAWIPGRGFVALGDYASGLGAVDNALQITDANQVVVHGTAAGVTDLYLLTL